MAHMRAAILLEAVALQVHASWLPSFAFDDCCKSDGVTGIGDGKCMDGSARSLSDPCCGLPGQCNSLCCNCEGGCKDEFYRKAPIPEPVAKMRSDIPLNQWPMLSAHDAATTYAHERTCTPHHMANNYAVTQARGGFDELLDCGARALDVRPYLHEANLSMHHGALEIKEYFQNALMDVVTWANLHKGTFVLLQISHYGGYTDELKEQCKPKAKEVMTNLGIKFVDCSAGESGELAGLTLGGAIQKGLLAGGGSVLAVDGSCVFSNYDSSIECYGEDSVAPTYKDNSCRRGPMDNFDSNVFKRFWEYMFNNSNSTEAPHKGSPLLWTTQAHWQYTTKSIGKGTASKSCILKDNEQSEVNLEVSNRIQADHYKHFNLLEIDYVCHHGQELFTALRKKAMRNVGLNAADMWDEIIDVNHNTFEVQNDGRTVVVKTAITYHALAGATWKTASKLLWSEAVDRPATNIKVTDASGANVSHNVVVMNAREQWVQMTFATPIVGPATYKVFFEYTIADGICAMECRGTERLFFHAEWSNPTGSIPVKSSHYDLKFPDMQDTKAYDVCTEQEDYCHDSCANHPNYTLELEYSGSQQFYGFTWKRTGNMANVEYRECSAVAMAQITNAAGCSRLAFTTTAAVVLLAVAQWFHRL